ncbi:MAG: UDPGP type 1 family protein [Candidatus Hydrogenedentes bacterium]|nr:UDPGP type 1 family protein [Candidatus Hydrogenedentota bacterium]
MALDEGEARRRLAEHGQEHVLRFWSRLGDAQRTQLLSEIASLDFALMDHLIRDWVLSEPKPETFSRVEPVPVYPVAGPDRADAREAWEAGCDALREGRVGLVLVAGGQGTRLGFEGPKGAYPIGPISGRSLFEFHAEKIHNLQKTFQCTLPWYIMVSEATAAETKEFFEAKSYFGLSPLDIIFFEQAMIPCVDEKGRFLLEEPHRLARNPNGHGGCIPALVENGITADAGNRGVQILSYFQVDNWAVKVADLYFIGYHVLHEAEMSSKVHRKTTPREPVGVHCVCDGQYRVIEYTELDIYPQLLETDSEGRPIHYAGNPAIHILSVNFVERVYEHFDRFPWHRAHKKIPYRDEAGQLVKPERPNGYKFETFVFDALRFTRHDPVVLEIVRPGEYTPIKQLSGDNSVESAWLIMREYWADWLEAAGCPVPRDASGKVSIKIEISPQFALSRDEFVRNLSGSKGPISEDVSIGPLGQCPLSFMKGIRETN